MRDISTVAFGLLLCCLMTFAIVNVERYFPSTDARYFPCLATCAFGFLIAARLARLGWIRQ